MKILVVNSGPNTSLYEIFTSSRGMLECEALDVAGLFAGVNLTDTSFLDVNTTTPPGSQVGNVEAPFATLAQCVTASGALLGADYTIKVANGDYSAQPVPVFAPGLGLRVTFSGVAAGSPQATPYVLPGVSNLTQTLAIDGAFIAGPVDCGVLVLSNCSCAVLGVLTANYLYLSNSVVNVLHCLGIAGGQVYATGCNFDGALTIDGIAARMINSTFNSGPVVVTFTGAPGVLTLDTTTYANFAAAGCSVVNGTISVLGGLRNLTRTLYVDQNTTTPAAQQIGNIEAPFATLAAAMALCNNPALSYEILITPADYHLEVLPPVAPGQLAIRNLGLMLGFWVGSPILPPVAYGAPLLTIEGCIFNAAMSAADLKLVSCEMSDIALTASLEATDSFLGAPVTGVTNVTANRCTIPAAITASGGVSFTQCQIGFTHTLTGGTGTHQAIYDDCRFTTAHNVDAGADILNATVRNCQFALRVDFIGAAGSTVNMDATSYAQQRIAGFITGPVLTLASTSLFAQISVVVPAIVAAGVDYADVSTVGTALEGIPANTPISANPTADLAAAGAGAGGFLNARVSAPSTIRCAFAGILAGGASDFVFSTMNGW